MPKFFDFHAFAPDRDEAPAIPVVITVELVRGRPSDMTLFFSRAQIDKIAARARETIDEVASPPAAMSRRPAH